MKKLSFIFSFSYIFFLFIFINRAFALDIVSDTSATDFINNNTFNINVKSVETDLKDKVKAINDSISLSDEDKKNELNKIGQISSLLNEIDNISNEKKNFEKMVLEAPSLFPILEKKLTEANTKFDINNIPEIKDYSDNEIKQKLSDLTSSQQLAQENLSKANAEFVNIQSLPTRAQATISKNTTAINNLSLQITNINSTNDSIDMLLQKVSYYRYELENQYLKEQLNHQNSISDIANYKVKIYTLETRWLNEYIRKIQSYLNEKVASKLEIDVNLSNSKVKEIPELEKEIKKNKEIIANIDNNLKRNSRMSQEVLEVENALSSVKQIEKNLSDQLTQLKGSLILSRLLNRQQSEIPSVAISFNLDELIPNLNIWMYDLRSYRDAIFDVNLYIDNYIKKNPNLKPHREELISIIKHRKELYDQLYLGLSESQNLAINLKLKYSEYQTIKAKVTSLINEHLFWLSSNLPLGIDFVKNYIPIVQNQLTSFFSTIGTEGFYIRTSQFLMPFFIPCLLLGWLLYSLSPTLNRIDNKLAMRIDKVSDGFFVTPLALLIKFFYILPKAFVIIGLGSIIIYIVLENPANHYIVMSMLALHVIVFLYFLEIFKVNSLSQRHFATPPSVVKMQRSFIDKVWFAVIPVLSIANIREIEPIYISTDNIGYTIVFICCIYLTCIIYKTFKQKFYSEEILFIDYIKLLCAIAVPLTLIVMLSLGYYYTAIKLINRIAYSFYICMLYVLLSNLIKRELYVAEIRLLKTSKFKALAILEKEAEDSNKLRSQGLDLIVKKDNSDNYNKNESVKFDLINTKAFKLINIMLLCAIAYLLYIQWSDLASVLSYLDTIIIWSSKTLVNGNYEITSMLTLADLSTAIIIFSISVILNKNLPALLERLFLLRFSVGHKSTSYTVRIISSYIITALGVIFSASALGISWDNLQWLVAALSVGLGFGLQEIFANFVSGLIILFERQIRVGDIVTLNGLSGTVNKIRIRATNIVSFDNKEVVIPNKEFITSALTNWSLSNTITMIEFAVGIAYDADPTKAKGILKSIVKSCKYLSHDKPPRIYIKSLDASSVTIMCEVFVNEIGNRKNTFDYLSEQTLKRFAKENIEIPFNQLDVKIKNLDTGDVLTVK